MAEISILSATNCHLGEGPFFCQRRNTLFWFDIVGKKRYAHDFESGTEMVEDLPEMTSAMGVTEGDQDVLFTESGLWLMEGAGLRQLVAIEADNPATRSNDARIHPSGAFWLGTMGKNAEPDAGAIYRYFEGQLERMFDAITIPNSICFSTDGGTAYFTDTATAKLMQVSVNPANGASTGEPTVFFDHTSGEGGLDGSVCDGDDRIWNARWGASALDCYAPDGQRIATIDLPVSQPSCPAFVGGNRIAVTSAFQAMDAVARANDPNAGSTLLVTLDEPIKPRFEPAVRL